MAGDRSLTWGRGNNNYFRFFYQQGQRSRTVVPSSEYTCIANEWDYLAKSSDYEIRFVFRQIVFMHNIGEYKLTVPLWFHTIIHIYLIINK